ncbi:MAG: NAD-dependent epimerase/dehydratase family protein [Candidatus Xenobiia bacterium LiM19]
MNVLVTGNKGYIGAVLCRILKEKGYCLTGLDTGYYDDCLLDSEILPDRQLDKDIRSVSAADFEGIDAVIHLAALSNDPIGELDAALTEDINLKGTIKAACCAKEAGVKRFIYSSSQSMYGIANTDEELDEDLSEKNPVTAYARTKWEAECALKDMADSSFHVICFRPSTVFGVSPRLRCDIVYNSFVACAYTTGKIEIKSDGTPWRPVVHVRDACKAFIAGVEAPVEMVSGESFNVGIPQGNYTVRELAEAAEQVVPGSEIVYTGEHGKDSRSYRVSFNKILRVLGRYYVPEWDLNRGGKEMVEFFEKIGFNEQHFHGRMCSRLRQIGYLRAEGCLDAELRWQRKVHDDI